MHSHEIFTASNRQKIAYIKSDAAGSGANLPGVVFLGGFFSNMRGTKAEYFHARCRTAGRAFLRFDYSGHGESSGEFQEGCIGDWADEAREAILALTDGPQILLGSSMGGWIALLVARRNPGKVAGLVGISVAPDFTEDSMWDAFDDTQRVELLETGRLAYPSEYSEEPYVITRRLIEDGRRHLVLRDPLDLPMPVRLLHGTGDTDVSPDVPLRLLSHATAPDMQLTLIKGADHRLSEPDNLEQIWQAVCDVTARRRRG